LNSCCCITSCCCCISFQLLRCVSSELLHPYCTLLRTDSYSCSFRVGVRVTLRLTVCFGVEPTLRTFDQTLLHFQEFGSGIYRGRISPVTSNVRVRLPHVYLLLHSNGDLRNSTVAGRLSMFATYGRYPWKASTDVTLTTRIQLVPRSRKCGFLCQLLTFLYGVVLD
jgi:hypothetical protein